MKQTLITLSFALILSLSGCKSPGTKSLIQEAGQGNATAQYELGVSYENGRGVMKHPNVAANWYRKAAEQGHAEAQYSLGRMYEKGWHWTGSFLDLLDKTYTYQKEDYNEALKWHRMAADQGNADAQYNLGTMYSEGNGVAKNALEAGRWYRKAAEQGHEKAKTETRVINDVNKFETALAAAEQGDAKAQYDLGYMYDRGNSVVSRNHDEAREWYLKAARQGEVQAQFQLGFNYNYGRGVSQNIIEALKWYRLAADQGHQEANTYFNLLSHFEENRQKAEKGDAQAQYELGRLYEYGVGVAMPEDSKAKKWYTLAAGQGHAEARTALDRMRHNETVESLRSENERLVRELRAENERLARELRDEAERLEQEHRARHIRR
jgi:TPR repeat protein